MTGNTPGVHVEHLEVIMWRVSAIFNEFSGCQNWVHKEIPESLHQHLSDDSVQIIQ